MLVVPCQPPRGQIEPAPMTLLASLEDGGKGYSAFWSGDDYLVKRDGEWFRIEPEVALEAVDEEARIRMGELAMSIIPLGPGRVAFPVGSGGRTVYRVWRERRRADGAEAADSSRGRRIRILGVRAGRSLRRPA